MARLTDAERQRAFGPPGDTSRYVTYRTPWGMSVRVHTLVLAPFRLACEEAARSSPWRPQRIDSFNKRTTRGASSWSLHAYALAWDFFATPPNVPPPGGVWTPNNGVPPGFAACFQRGGFTWGATFSRGRDVPHIEWAGPRPGIAVPPTPSTPEEDDLMTPDGRRALVRLTYFAAFGRPPESAAVQESWAEHMANHGLDATVQAITEAGEPTKVRGTMDNA